MSIIVSRPATLDPQDGRLWIELGAAFWHRSAPKTLRRAFSARGESVDWDAWVAHLARRPCVRSLSQLAGGRNNPLAWALPEDPPTTETVSLFEQVHEWHKGRPLAKPPREALATWLAGNPGSPITPGYALESIAWCHALPRLAAAVPPAIWWKAMEHLAGLAAEAHNPALNDCPLIQQCLGGELGLALGYLFPEITACRRLAAAASRVLSAGLTGLLDGEGVLLGKHFDLLRPLLGCWTRSGLIGEWLPEGAWDSEAQIRYEWLVRQALRVTRPDGTHAMSAQACGVRSDGLFEAALRLGGDDIDREIAAVTLSNGKRWAAGRVNLDTLPDSAMHSEWASVTVLRPDWSRNSARLAAVYPDQTLRIELARGSEVLLSGQWDFDLRCDGQPVRPLSKWEEICWQSDDDIDYLELEIRLSGGLRLQRHLGLAREDGFLFLADTVLGDRPAQWDYRSRLPLCGPVAFEPAEETREGYLVRRKRVASVLPLALPEWRNDSRPGSLAVVGGSLELQQSEDGRSMFSPLFLDLCARRLSMPCTWRQLTVAEDFAVVPPEVARGYRVMAGRKQWLIYRSLAGCGNRTLLGHNLATSMLVARFDADGEVEPLIEIE